MNVEFFRERLIDECQIDLNKPLVAGISGGPDSLCMLDLLIKTGVPLFVLHINHQLRKEAEAEAQMVSDFCKQQEVECKVIKADVMNFAKVNHFSIEEASRSLRYRELFSHAESVKAQAVLVAHNADDQVETVLMHLLRGSGLGGLRGMQFRSIQNQFSSTIPLIRPLLSTGRAEILDYCRDYLLTPSVDQTNTDTQYFRNRIRHELIPELASYNPRFKDLLVTMANIIRLDDDFLTMKTDESWQDLLVKSGSQYVILGKERLNILHPAILRRILRKAIFFTQPGLRDVDYKCIDRAADFVVGKVRANQFLLISDVEIINYLHDGILFCRKNDSLNDLWPQLEVDNMGLLEDKGQRNLLGNWMIKWEVHHQIPSIEDHAWTATLDADKLHSMRLDVFKPGDRFIPFGLAGEQMKLGDYWTNQGLPRKARKAWPLVRNDQNEIVWVVGMQIDDKFKVTKETKQTLVMKLDKTT